MAELDGNKFHLKQSEINSLRDKRRNFVDERDSLHDLLLNLGSSIVSSSFLDKQMINGLISTEKDQSSLKSLALQVLETPRTFIDSYFTFMQHGWALLDPTGEKAQPSLTVYVELWSPRHLRGVEQIEIDSRGA